MAASLPHRLPLRRLWRCELPASRRSQEPVLCSSRAIHTPPRPLLASASLPCLPPRSHPTPSAYFPSFFFSRGVSTASSPASARPAFSSATPTSTTAPSKSSGAPPTLNATLRRFYFLVHPDLFHSHPLHRACNEQSLQHFMGFITAMKQTSAAEPWPPSQHTNLTFYVRRKRGDGINTAIPFVQWNEAREAKRRGKGKAPRAVCAAVSGVDGEFHVLRLTLSTNGGNCRGLVERQLRHLFHMMGLREDFTWDDEYWQLKPRIDRKDGEEEQREEEGEEDYAYH